MVKGIAEIFNVDTATGQSIIEAIKIAKNKDLPDQILDSDIEGFLKKLTQKEIDNLPKSIERDKIQSINSY